MITRRIILAVCLAAAAGALPSAQTDLDALMARVLARRDENWKKLQQYTLHEKESVQLTALAVFRLFGYERKYLWFPRAGFFVRSPLEADGVRIGEDERAREEERWLRNAQRREQRADRTRRRTPDCSAPAAGTDAADDVPPAHEPDDLPSDATATIADIVSQSFEPEFIRAANFLRFTFDEGRYAFVDRDRMLDRDVLQIEYYPTNLFNDGPCPRRGDAKNERERKFNEQMNKSSLVILWIDPAEAQILRYEFRNVDMDFLPGRSIVRIDSMTATMQMSEPFPSVWLPASIAMRFRVTTAAGPVEGRYDIAYTDYRLPTVTGHAVVDTRIDPSFPRDAVHARIGWERLAFGDGRANRWLTDVRGYVGIGGSRVLALRAQLAHTDSAIPAAEQPLLGGSNSLRGYPTGYRAGDNMAAGTIEMRQPFNAPWSVGRFGVKAFVDAGTTWNADDRMGDQRFDRGIGGGVYAGVGPVVLDLDVAKPADGRIRAHFGLGVTF